jgi:NAD(P)-dependent dehydrogenase (short-subunit alcohol dehydrogenase family)
MRENNQLLASKVVLITGAGRNLGAVVAAEFASHGAFVAITDCQYGAEALARIEALNLGPGRAAHFVSDASDPAQIVDVVAKVKETFGPVDILINNAGPFSLDPYLKLKVEEWDKVIDVNLRAIYLFTQQVAPGMNERGWGRIINISAGSAFLRNHSVYGLAKAAVRFLTEELALELKPGVTINAISPGQIAESAPDIAVFDPTFVERAIAITPTGRLVTRPDIAKMMVELCSPSFDMVTGMTIPMDGGARLPRF